ncbi:GAF domain-containing protein [Azoarcus sp. TTM-91]|uniref:GAF domain-containing protein n=1 Tax=Azoarcus sp. TTM-91 TaxID=2691581 RepID=UPI00145F2DCF|nr:GAF domain-containing protein [Azoarcus sp. TTM-91]NMG36620.1 GAF domain-containing protein [Azoarcus sp. TTM-91]
MKAPPLPDDETERLARLHALRILDTPAEQRFDALTTVAAAVANVPIALISLVDENRQWFKSACGTSVTETAREISFCGHAILSGEPLVVADAACDERFFDNPLVTGTPWVRFYAGFPLQADGARIGTLCVIDDHPRQLTPEQIAELTAIARVVEQELRPPQGQGK